jgi:hypothetical protein
VSKAFVTSRQTALASSLVNVSVDSFNKAGQLQRRALSGSKPKLLVTADLALLLVLGPYLVGSCRKACQQCQVDKWVCRKKAVRYPFSDSVRICERKSLLVAGNTC